MSGMELLFALGALDTNGSLTEPLGLHMAELPLAPLLAKMVLGAAEFSCTEEALSIAAMLQVENVFIRPARGDQKVNAERCRRKFSVLEGDHITLLNVYAAFIKFGRSSQWCRQNFVHYKGMCRAVEIRKQLQQFLVKLKLPSGNSKSTILMFLSFHPACNISIISTHVIDTIVSLIDWLTFSKGMSQWPCGLFQWFCCSAWSRGKKIEFFPLGSQALSHELVFWAHAKDRGHANFFKFSPGLFQWFCCSAWSRGKKIEFFPLGSQALSNELLFWAHAKDRGHANFFKFSPGIFLFQTQRMSPGKIQHNQKIIFITFKKQKKMEKTEILPVFNLTQSKSVWRLIKFFFQISSFASPSCFRGALCDLTCCWSPVTTFFSLFKFKMVLEHFVVWNVELRFLSIFFSFSIFFHFFHFFQFYDFFHFFHFFIFFNFSIFFNFFHFFNFFCRNENIKCHKKSLWHFDLLKIFFCYCYLALRTLVKLLIDENTTLVGDQMEGALYDVDAVRRCIVAGFFANAAYLHPSGVYRTVRNDHELHIHPSSVLYAEKPPAWYGFSSSSFNANKKISSFSAWNSIKPFPFFFQGGL